MMPETANAEIAERWEQALTGDASRLEGFQSPAMRVWHSHDDLWSDVAQPTEGARETTPAAVPKLHDVRTLATEQGFLLRGWFDALDDSGRRMHIVQVLTVEDGLIVSCEEYIAPQKRGG